MALILTQTLTAIAPNLTASFQAVGGSTPYAYAVIADGAGGAVNASTGVYTAPAVVNSNPAKLYDIIQVTDHVGAQATAYILIGTPLLLFCEVLQQEMGLAVGRVYLWDQKIMQPQDSDLYIAVSVPSCRPFANVNRAAPSGGALDSVQYVSVQATVDMDIISRGPSARDRKEEVTLALNSTYAQQQQEINSFYIGKLPPSGRFVNLSQIDGAAIPYRYRISINMQYAVTKTRPVDYFNDFTRTIYTNA